MSRDLSGRDRFLAEMNVSRETLDRLDVYAALLEKWSPAINLVARSTIPDLWDRHMRDSAQVMRHAGVEAGHWADLGSGGGFPGAVCAILARETAPDLTFTLVEADARKGEFLRTVGRETGIPMRVLTARIEDAPPLSADLISARALAPLKTLLSHAARHLKPTGRALFLKGASFREEIEEALESWRFQSEEYPSSTDDAGIVLGLGEIRRV